MAYVKVKSKNGDVLFLFSECIRGVEVKRQQEQYSDLVLATDHGDYLMWETCASSTAANIAETVMDKIADARGGSPHTCVQIDLREVVKDWS